MKVYLPRNEDEPFALSPKTNVKIDQAETYTLKGGKQRYLRKLLVNEIVTKDNYSCIYVNEECRMVHLKMVLKGTGHGE